MRCAADKLELVLTPDHSVILTLRCQSALEALVLFEDINEASQAGSLVMEFEVGKRRIITPPS